MANTKQAKKRALQNDRQRLRNKAVKTITRTAVKTVRRSAATDAAKAVELVPLTQSTLDVAVRKGVLHKKTASRLKSRVAKAVGKAVKAASAATAAKPAGK